MLSLPDSDKQLLLKLARLEVRLAATGDCSQFTRHDPLLIDLEGAFVTLLRRRRLRGCIGRLSARDPLTAIVAYCARAAALEPPRFSPVRAAELPEIEIEISLLSPAEDVTLERIKTGKHGLIVSNGSRRGVLLPQVALQFHLSAERFPEQTCVKASLDRNAWREPTTRIQAFTADVFSGAVDAEKKIA